MLDELIPITCILGENAFKVVVWSNFLPIIVFHLCFCSHLTNSQKSVFGTCYMLDMRTIYFSVWLWYKKKTPRHKQICYIWLLKPFGKIKISENDWIEPLIWFYYHSFNRLFVFCHIILNTRGEGSCTPWQYVWGSGLERWCETRVNNNDITH